MGIIASITSVVLWMGLTYMGLFLTNSYVKDPYMDEPFHVAQTQRYCQGDYTYWDPKITTFPGLYMVGVMWTKLLSWIKATSQEMLCSTMVLRSTNLALGLFAFLMVHRLLENLHGHGPGHLLHTWVLSLFPLHFFYIFLFYTDVGSTAFLMSTYLALRTRRIGWATVSGVMAVLFRQTNAVWVTFLLGAAVLEDVRSQGAPQTSSTYKKNDGDDPLADPVRAHAVPLGQTRAQQQSGLGFVDESMGVLKALWRSRALLFWRYLPMLVIPCGFITFLIVNKGVTLGDKDAHRPVKHVAQLLYLAVFVVGSSWPYFLSVGQLKSLMQEGRQWPWLRMVLSMVGVLGGFAIIVSHWTLVHPYLLSDNRHYTFYLWKRVMERHWRMRYLLVPVYGTCWALVVRRVLAMQSPLWLLGFLASCVVTLVPAWLLEFRYFTAPTLILLLHMKPPSRGSLVLVGLQHLVVNIVTLYIFNFRPFLWGDGSMARFMW